MALADFTYHIFHFLAKGPFVFHLNNENTQNCEKTLKMGLPRTSKIIYFYSGNPSGLGSIAITLPLFPFVFR